MRRHANSSKASRHGAHAVDEDDSDGNPNDQWTPEDPDVKEDYASNYSSDPEEVNYKKKRIRKKGRKAKFLVEQLMYDQQMMANQQSMMRLQSQQSTYLPNQPQISPMYPQQSYSWKQPRYLPELETVGKNHIPGIIDVVPRGQH
ncbi:hypothetical protein TVAG_252490 [Trichomonas vaginalis G3]|uniref:Uncharacterized protein n=1 Tax=Trichomonas vaginalis (strain ATCC PRA-98 / G3) TaxID=412133 RepID=A2DVZ1_TRIV3|nr:hypothetical protein TVAGG3_0845860 [Trichomonas vaginalis G3]EAY15436.1 hypothetical protein TVAG_252490 [Trichomonas vaginalis G3]KAI5499601.1 hypothetical protein TVAGG3_0845860 [Trichomonas vaginalis G3]|eukprot:XP_001327659.1 hypothetical protein [Trichomonas vaginalis G3]